jgi:hypothetical protein
MVVATDAIKNAFSVGHQYDGGDTAIKPGMSMVFSERRLPETGYRTQLFLLSRQIRCFQLELG